jgi:hypothetical protein
MIEVALGSSPGTIFCLVIVAPKHALRHANPKALESCRISCGWSGALGQLSWGVGLGAPPTDFCCVIRIPPQTKREGALYILIAYIQSCRDSFESEIGRAVYLPSLAIHRPRHFKKGYYNEVLSGPIAYEIIRRNVKENSPKMGRAV